MREGYIKPNGLSGGLSRSKTWANSLGPLIQTILIHMKLVWKELLLKSSPVLTLMADNGRDGLVLFSFKTLIFGEAFFSSMRTSHSKHSF